MMDTFEKIITINTWEDKDCVRDNILRLLYFMYEHSPNVKYFRFKFTDSERNPMAKDLVLMWAAKKKEGEE